MTANRGGPVPDAGILSPDAGMLSPDLPPTLMAQEHLALSQTVPCIMLWILI